MKNKSDIPENFNIDGVEYKSAELSSESLEILKKLTFTTLKLREIQNEKALMEKARNAYISDIKFEVVQSESGFDLDNLFDED